MTAHRAISSRDNSLHGNVMNQWGGSDLRHACRHLHLLSHQTTSSSRQEQCPLPHPNQLRSDGNSGTAVQCYALSL